MLQRMWKEAAVAWRKVAYYTGICWRNWGKLRKELSQDSRSPAEIWTQDLKIAKQNC
jgi:hypothetical protein